MRLKIIVCVFVLSLMNCAQAQVKPLGRLFFTVAERASLDRLRSVGSGNDQAVSTKEVDTDLSSVANQTELQLTVNGFVRRGNGKSTTWLNQTAIEENQSSQHIRVRQSAARPSVMLIYLDSGQKTELKVGQSVDRASGQVRDVFDPEFKPTQAKSQLQKVSK